jgi:predicted metal-binding membrane protein
MRVRLRPKRGDLDSAIRSLAARERLLVLSGVTAVVALSGAHLRAWGPGAAPQWSAAHGWLVFGMWAATMVTVMTPSAAPMLLAYAKHGGGEAPEGRTLPALLAGHLALWTCVSAAAALAHWGLHAAEVLAPGVSVANPVAGGILLASTGVYQLTLPRAACLAERRTPPAGQRSDSASGAFLVGARHALCCVGRCWPLMALLFVGGVIMSPLWIAVLTLIAMAAEILPYGESIGHGVAVGAIGWGLWLLAGALA